MGKNNLLLALKELQKEGMSFQVSYSRGPFFLRGSQATIDYENKKLGCPKDAPQYLIREARIKNDPAWTARFAHMETLFEQAQLSPRDKKKTDNRVPRHTMQAHRLAQYAAQYESNEKGEKMWFAMSRRWFMGKDTEIETLKLDDPKLLKECARFAGLDMNKVDEVLAGKIISEDEILNQVHAVHAVGINSIPQIVLEVDGLAKGEWRSDPTLPDNMYRATHHGSGSKDSFKALIVQLHTACSTAPAC